MAMFSSPARCALSIYAAAAMLAGCSGSTSPSYQLPGMNESTRAQSLSSAGAVHDASCQGQRSFQYIGRVQRFKVPKCATTIYIDAFGAEGALGGGDGGEVSATIPVTPGEMLIVRVGGAGDNFKGGFNGGGAGAQSRRIRGVKPGGAGGGASDVRQGGNVLADRVVVAGGGGGEGGDGGATGGTGGGLPDGGSGGALSNCEYHTAIGGGGGTQSSGGAGGRGKGRNGGSQGDGGIGVGGCAIPIINQISMSSGGGGGYYGGGGGGYGGAGGGGSGYAEPSATNVSSQNGVNSGNGTVLICWGYSNEMCGTN